MSAGITLLKCGRWAAVLGLFACAASEASSNAAPLSSTSGGTEATPGAQVEAPKPQQPLPLDVRAIVDAPDRSDQDRTLDEQRRPGDLLAFLALRPGMKVAEIGAGTGYTMELLARSVAPDGKAYGVNSKWVLDRFADEPWSARLGKPVMKNAVRLDRPFDDPFPAEVSDLDLVCSVLVYHDFFWMDVDRAAMNAAVFRALKPGGAYVVVDHSAQEGSAARDVRSLHRVERATVIAEIEKAGFRLADEAQFLRNPEDTRDWNAAPSAAGERRGESDRFVLKFIKP